MKLSVYDVVFYVHIHVTFGGMTPSFCLISPFISLVSECCAFDADVNPYLSVYRHENTHEPVSRDEISPITDYSLT